MIRKLLKFFRVSKKAFDQSAPADPGAGLPNLNVVVHDVIKYNETRCQKELICKVNYAAEGPEGSGTKKLIEDTLDFLLGEIRAGNVTGSAAADDHAEEYYYFWSYTDNTPDGLAGWAKIYPDAQVQATGLQGFKAWLETIVKDWAQKNGLIWINTKHDKPGEYFLKINFDVPTG